MRVSHRKNGSVIHLTHHLRMGPTITRRRTLNAVRGFTIVRSFPQRHQVPHPRVAQLLQAQMSPNNGDPSNRLLAQLHRAERQPLSRHAQVRPVAQIKMMMTMMRKNVKASEVKIQKEQNIEENSRSFSLKSQEDLSPWLFFLLTRISTFAIIVSTFRKYLRCGDDDESER